MSAVMQQSGVPQFLTVKEVAALLRVKPRTIYQWVAEAKIPHHKPSRNVLLFDRDEVIAWLKGAPADENAGQTVGAQPSVAIPFAPQRRQRSQP